MTFINICVLDRKKCTNDRKYFYWRDATFYEVDKVIQDIVSRNRISMVVLIQCLFSGSITYTNQHTQFRKADYLD